MTSLKYFDGQLCQVEGCSRKPTTRGLCQKHYMRQWRHGAPIIIQARHSQDAERVRNLSRAAVGHAITYGRLLKPSDCSGCGLPFASRHLQAHHPDYAKPLDVVWLCRWCHAKLHSRLRRQSVVIGVA